LNVTSPHERIRVNISEQATGCLVQQFLFCNGEQSMAYYEFWIHDKDKNGEPLDERILKAVKEILSTLIRYRFQEIGCESTANEILQSAVEAASKSASHKRIDNPHGYITRIYRNFVDNFLDQWSRLVPVENKILEFLANSRRMGSVEELINSRLDLEKLMRVMDAETRRIYNWKRVGFSIGDIAKELRITPNAVSIRLWRGTQKALQNLREGSQGQK
jgi:DNA-directed RNA polymerase specialized sigma24 family protein